MYILALAKRADQEMKAANLLNWDSKRKGVTYAGLIERLAQLGVDEKEVNVRNEFSKGKFTAVFLQCLEAIDTDSLRF